MTRILWLVLLASALQAVLAVAPVWADRADWERWVYQDANAKDNDLLRQPGSIAAAIRFGYAYCQQRDKNLRAPQLDERVIARLEKGLWREVPSLNSADGTQYIDTLASEAQRFMCP
jgi:hypothetical protein